MTDQIEMALLPCPNPWCEASKRTDGDFSPMVGRCGMGETFQTKCPDCFLCGPVRWTKAEAVTGWNTRPSHLPPDVSALQAEVERLREENAELRNNLASANDAHWFYYLGNDCSIYPSYRSDINECIEDFEWDKAPKGDHVLQISGARPVPDMWVALHYFTDDEKDARDDDEPYTYTVHDSEEAARAALKGDA